MEAALGQVWCGLSDGQRWHLPRGKLETTPEQIKAVIEKFDCVVY